MAKQLSDSNRCLPPGFRLQIGRSTHTPSPSPRGRAQLHVRICNLRSQICNLFGESPVHDLDFAEGTDHDIGRFEVAVDYALRVSVADCLADLVENREKAGQVGGFPLTLV